MKNDPIRATGEAMPTITRRALLASGTAAAVIAAPAATQAAGISAEMHNLIETHRTLFAAWAKTMDPREDAEDAYKEHQKKVDPVVVPVLIGGAHGIRNGRKETRQFVADAFRNQRNRLEIIERLDPDMAKRMRELLDAKEAENLALVETAYDEEDARQEAFGLTAAVNAYDEAAEAADSALWELCAHYCQTLADERARAAYIFSDRRVRDILLMDPDYSMALLQTTAAIEDEEAS